MNELTMQILWPRDSAQDTVEDQVFNNTSHQESSSTVGTDLDFVIDFLDITVDTKDMGDTGSSDNTHDLMLLTPSMSFTPEVNEKICRFKGKLENHPRATAAVVGCMGDDVTFVNINLNGEFKILWLTKDGKTWTKIPNGKRDTYFRPGFVDFLEITEEAPTVMASRVGPPPKAITLPYTLGNIL